MLPCLLAENQFVKQKMPSAFGAVNHRFDPEPIITLLFELELCSRTPASEGSLPEFMV
jgi:hypothetical protein